MTVVRFIAALLAVGLGIFFCARKKQPLFFKILLFGCASFLLGSIFEGCWALVYREMPTGFHIGYLGYMGAYFFFLSAHYGAINRLADGGEKEYRPYRAVALIGPVITAAVTVWSVWTRGVLPQLPMLLLAVPIAMELYFAVKHLLLPDVEMGIIKVMRPYNVCVILLCLSQLISEMTGLGDMVRMIAGCAVSLILIVLLPVAETGVQKWYI